MVLSLLVSFVIPESHLDYTTSFSNLGETQYPKLKLPTGLRAGHKLPFNQNMAKFKRFALPSLSLQCSMILYVHQLHWDTAQPTVGCQLLDNKSLHEGTGLLRRSTIILNCYQNHFRKRWSFLYGAWTYWAPIDLYRLHTDGDCNPF